MSHSVKSHDFQCELWNLFSKCVSIVVHANFFLSDKKFIPLNSAHKFFTRIFLIYVHLGVSIQRFLCDIPKCA